MRLAGHETRNVFDRYNIITNDDLVNASQRLADAAGKDTGKDRASGAVSAKSGRRKCLKNKVGRE